MCMKMYKYFQCQTAFIKGDIFLKYLQLYVFQTEIVQLQCNTFTFKIDLARDNN